MPAILILGFDLQLVQVALISVLGGLLGILMMIPRAVRAGATVMRRAVSSCVRRAVRA